MIYTYIYVCPWLSPEANRLLTLASSSRRYDLKREMARPFIDPRMNRPASLFANAAPTESTPYSWFRQVSWLASQYASVQRGQGDREPTNFPEGDDDALFEAITGEFLDVTLYEGKFLIVRVTAIDDRGSVRGSLYNVRVKCSTDCGLPGWLRSDQITDSSIKSVDDIYRYLPVCWGGSVFHSPFS